MFGMCGIIGDGACGSVGVAVPAAAAEVCRVVLFGVVAVVL